MNMFARKPKTLSSQAALDELNRKKCATKILDPKKDIQSRLKYLKIYIESTDNLTELKQFFDQNYNQIYFIFYESFINVETNLKQKISKLNKEELDTVLFIFQKILILQPEKINQRWQVRSIGRSLQKLLHIGNAKSVKLNGLRLFLLWYQILNKNRTNTEELMFQKLIHGFDLFHSSVPAILNNTTIGFDMLNAEAQKVFSHVHHELSNQTSNLLANSSSGVSAITAAFMASTNRSTLYHFEITPLIPVNPQYEQLLQQHQEQSSQQQSQQAQFQQQQIQLAQQTTFQQQQQQLQYQQSSQQQQQQANNVYALTAELLKHMLEYMQQDFMLIEWSVDRPKQAISCYEFLFEEFKRFYLAYMFPNAFILSSNKPNSSSNLNQLPPTSNNQSAPNLNNSCSLNVYANIDLLNLINTEQTPTYDRHQQIQNDEKKQTQLNCKEEIIKWLINVLLIDLPLIQTSSSSASTSSSIYVSTTSTGTNQSQAQTDANSSGIETLKASNSQQSYYDDFESGFGGSSSSTNSARMNKQLIQKVLLSTQSNVNLVHEILRNTYFLNFDDNSQTVKFVLDAYKKWFLNEVKMPSFMLEPQPCINDVHLDQIRTDSSLSTIDMVDEEKISLGSSSITDEKEFLQRTSSISSSSSLAIPSSSNSCENTKIGFTKSLQIFFYHSSNLLLNRYNLQKSDRIKNICCYLLDIYKQFIKYISMDNYTWTMLIKILLRVCNYLFSLNSEYLSSSINLGPSSVNSSNRTEQSSLSQLIKLITETTLMGMIKATYNFNLSNEIWDQLLALFQMVNSNQDVVDKWMESIDELIRQIFKIAYNIDINSMSHVISTNNLNGSSHNGPGSDPGAYTNSYEQKRKLKQKKNLYTANTTVPSSNTQTATISQSTVSNYLISSLATPNDQPSGKPRSKTEVSYSPAVLSTVGLNSPINIITNVSQNANISSSSSIPSKSSQPNSSSLSNQTTTITKNSNSNTSNTTNSNSNTTIQNLVPLIRQPSTKHILQNTFRDDTYLHTFGNMTIHSHVIDSGKSPSLSDEHFMSITDQQVKTNSSANSPSGSGSKTNSTNTNNSKEAKTINVDEKLNTSATIAKSSKLISSFNSSKISTNSTQIDNLSNNQLQISSTDYEDSNDDYEDRSQTLNKNANLAEYERDADCENELEDDDLDMDNETSMDNTSSSQMDPHHSSRHNNNDNIDSIDADADDDESFDKTSTLKATNQNQFQLNRVDIEEDFLSKSHGRADTLTMNRFNSDKSIYYSSELLAESASSTSNVINTLTNLDDSTSNDYNDFSTDNNSNSSNQTNNNTTNSTNNSLTLSISNAQTTTSPSINLKQYSPNLPSSPTVSSSINKQIPPPLPPLPASLPSKFYLLNQQSQQSKSTNLDQSDSSTNFNSQFNNTPSNELFAHSNKPSSNSSSNGIISIKDKMNIDTDIASSDISSASSSVQASPLGKLLQTSNNSNQVEFSLSSSTYYPYIENQQKQQQANSTLTRTDERSASFIMDNSNNQKYMGMNKIADQQQSQVLNNTNQVKQSANQSLLSIGTALTVSSGYSTLAPSTNSSSSQNKNRQSISIITNNANINSNNQVNIQNENTYENDWNKKFKKTSILLLKRLFGCMGNVNFIKDPHIHKKIFEFILYKWEKLSKIKDEFKLLNTNTTTKVCELIMPQSYFAPWLFEAIHKYFDVNSSFSPNYQMGILIAYKILCNIVIKSSISLNSIQNHKDENEAENIDSDLDQTKNLKSNPCDDFYNISNDFMDLFYISLHYGLRSNDKNVINCIIQSCNTRFWHLMLESSSLLIKDFIDACSSLDSFDPKLEAASILGSFICLPEYFGDNITMLNSSSSQLYSSSPSNKSDNLSDGLDSSLNVDTYTREDFKTMLIHAICNFEILPNSDTNINNYTNSRCVILCSLTCFIYDEIISSNNSKSWNTQLLNEASKRIFKDLDFRDIKQFNPVLVKLCCDNLRFISCLATVIFQKEIQFAINIINELNQCLVKLINNKPATISEEYEKAIIANMFALLEWCMNMPLEQLKDNDRATLLKNNFKLIIHICNTFKQGESIEAEHIHLAAKFIISHLLNQLNHYPFGTYGPTKICSSCNETSDLFTAISSASVLDNNNFLGDDLSPLLFEQPNIQFFTVNNQFLLSFIELPMKNNEKYFNNLNQKLKLSQTVCRFIVRDFSGKYCWDCCLLNSPDEYLPKCYTLEIPESIPTSPTQTTSVQNDSSNSIFESLNSTEESSNLFDYTQLPKIALEQIPKNIDILENILEYINYSSPECRLESSIGPTSGSNKQLSNPKSINPKLNHMWDISSTLQSNLEDIKQKLITQSIQETKYCQNLLKNELTQQTQPSPLKPESNQASITQLNSYFHLCKSFVHQMGLLSWEKRQSFHLLHKSSQLLRELKSLDDQTCRETHKIALIYIGPGQEDKQSILSNEKGSKDYEDFLSTLAWPINLETHEGFRGGLQHISSQLKTAPYYSNSLCEVLFHVSTQMNNQNDQNKISKWRHLGNDSVQIIWSEHSKDYDRSILATEFADVIICIYPLKNGLFRIQITKKHSVGFFGPLFDGAILHKSIMPQLIRATAINASRVLLSNTKGYQDFYVHRAHGLNSIMNKLTEKQTFEQFIVDIYSPNINSPQQQQQQQQPQQVPIVNKPKETVASSNQTQSILQQNTNITSNLGSAVSTVNLDNMMLNINNLNSLNITQLNDTISKQIIS